MKKYRNLFLFTIITSVILLGTTVVLLYFSAKRQQNDRYITIDPDTIQLVQLEAPKDGDPIAVVDTTLGEIRIVLYPDRSPNAVKNFTELAESGWYDNTYVYDSIEGVYASAGCKQKNGELTGGADSSRERTERELSQDLWPFKGAVCMLNTEKESTFKNKLIRHRSFGYIEMFSKLFLEFQIVAHHYCVVILDVLNLPLLAGILQKSCLFRQFGDSHQLGRAL